MNWGDLVAQVVDYAIIRLDLDGAIRSWNLGAEAISGYTATEAVGRSLAVFYDQHERDEGLPSRLLDEARQHQRSTNSGWRVRKDGTRYWGDSVFTALHDDAGTVTGFLKVTRDHTEQHELETRLRESEERFRLLVSQVVDYAIVAIDPQGIVQTWNRGAERLKGYTADEALGRSFAMFYTPEDREAGLPQTLLDLARTRGHVEHTGWRVRKDGRRFWADVVITALTDERGRVTGYAKVIRDLTARKNLEDAQDAFYATFNHDFRTPITALKGFVDALRYAPDDARERLIDRAEASADRLLDMVSDLVEVATQRAGRATMLMGDIDVAEVARAVVRDLHPSFDPGRVQVADDVAVAWANGDAMHRVLTNLVINALKYSPPAAPVSVSFDRSEAGHQTVTVSDRGRGIKGDDVDTIFDEFVRGDLAQDDGGTGLGLTSVRDLVEQQHGTVRIETEVGVGTSVTVVLRTEQAPAVRSAQSNGSSPTGHPSG